MSGILVSQTLRAMIEGGAIQALAFAILGAARGGVAIARPEVVEKSWPGFWAAFEGLRADLPARGVSAQNVAP